MRTDLSPIERELAEYLRKQDDAAAYEEWRQIQLSVIADIDGDLFRGELREFLQLIRDGEFEEAALRLKQADDAYLERIMECQAVPAP